MQCALLFATLWASNNEKEKEEAVKDNKDDGDDDGPKGNDFALTPFPKTRQCLLKRVCV